LELEDIGWTPAFAAAFQPFAADGRPARISAVHRNMYRVLDGQGEPLAVVSGQLFHQVEAAVRPTVGDWVVLDARSTAPAVIRAVLPRVTCLQRKAAGRTSDAQALAANVDSIAIVMGLDGDFNLRRLERTLVLVHASGAASLVLLNKGDLAVDVDDRLREAEAVAGGARVHVVSALHGDGLDVLAPSLVRGRTLVLLGSSGAGKSTLANRLGAPEQTTAAVRAHDARGRHTTTARQLFVLPSGALLIDTPGLREMQLLGDDPADSVFDDITALGAECRFRDCTHANEPGCAVRAAIASGALPAARLEGLRKLNAEARHQAEREDPTLARERKAKWKAIHKAQKKHRKE
jgi:ribosome biogenesis GTPase